MFVDVWVLERLGVWMNKAVTRSEVGRAYISQCRVTRSVFVDIRSWLRFFNLMTYCSLNSVCIICSV